MLKGQKFQVKLATPAIAASAAAASTDVPTHPGAIPLEDKALKVGCPNAVVVSVLTLQNRKNKMVLDIIVELAGPLSDRHTHHSRELRDVTRTTKWAIEQANGGFLDYIMRFLRLLFDTDALQRCGFQIDCKAAVKGWNLEVSQKIILKFHTLVNTESFCSSSSL